MNDDFEQQVRAFGLRGVLFGLDPGEKTIGVAVCDPGRRLAMPLETLRHKKFTHNAARLAGLAAERQVTGFVIGLPLNMNGTEGPRARSARALGRNLLRVMPSVPVAFWDERLSTAAMDRAFIAAGKRRAQRAEHIDAAAAAYILQGAMDRMKRLCPSAGSAAEEARNVRQKEEEPSLPLQQGMS